MDNFIDPRLIKRLGLRSLCLERPRKIWNIDGTNNKAGMISDYVDLNVQSVTITRGKTLDSAVMTTRAEMYH
jgi:hypothetical protein